MNNGNEKKNKKKKRHSQSDNHIANHIAILKPFNPCIDVSKPHKIGRLWASDFWNIRSGCN